MEGYLKCNGRRIGSGASMRGWCRGEWAFQPHWPSIGSFLSDLPPISRQLACSTNTKHGRNVYTGQLHVPVQPHASPTSQSVVKIHHIDRSRVIITNPIITWSHPIHSATRNESFPCSTPCAHVLRRAASFLVPSASESWTL